MFSQILDFFFGETENAPKASGVRFVKLDCVPNTARGKYIRFSNSGSQKAYAQMSMYKDIRRAEGISIDLPRGAIGICTRVNGQCLTVAFDSSPVSGKYPRKNPMSCCYCVSIFPLSDGRWEIED